MRNNRAFSILLLIRSIRCMNLIQEESGGAWLEVTQSFSGSPFCLILWDLMHRIFTACNRRMGKVLFSQVCVCPQGGGYPMVSGPRSLPWSLVPGPSQGHSHCHATGPLEGLLLRPVHGIPQYQPGQGVPPLATTVIITPHRTELGWLCGVGGMSLAFTQEDYLVRIYCCPISWIRWKTHTLVMKLEWISRTYKVLKLLRLSWYGILFYFHDKTWFCLSVCVFHQTDRNW